MYEYKGIITNIVDGDTFDVTLDLGFHINLNVRMRLLDCDTPESRGKEKNLGKIVTEYITPILLNKEFIFRTTKADGPTTDSFGRWLCSVSSPTAIFTNNGFINFNELINFYNYLGINKYKDNYNENNVYKLYDQ